MGGGGIRVITPHFASLIFLYSHCVKGSSDGGWLAGCAASFENRTSFIPFVCLLSFVLNKRTKVDNYEEFRLSVVLV